tara:strand:+ start:189 stop:797 length:609 start_codon:yes stop_codon:yes gene_type:complete
VSLPEELIEAVEYLSGAVTISSRHEDGRLNSVDDEDMVLELLTEQYGEENVVKPPIRTWWDLKLFGYHTNIKSSDFTNTASDNFSSKAAMLFALTNLPASEIHKFNKWQDWYTALRDNSGTENNRDYYIIVLDKSTGNVYLQTLKSLQVLTANGSNLIFQIKWSSNTEIVERTYEEAYEFLVERFKEGVKKRLEVHDGYEDL